MSSKKLLFIISLAILAGSLMSFNANSELNFDSVTSAIEVETDTLPGDIQKRVAELHRKREEIRKEVERIKAEEEAKAAKKIEADQIALEKEQKKANKKAIALLKAEEKARKKAAKAEAQAPAKAAAKRLAIEKKKQREVEKAAKKVEAEILANKRKKQREIDAVERAKIKAEQDATALKEKTEADRLKAIKKVENDKLKAIKKAEADRLAEIRKKQREADAIAKAKANALKAAERGDTETEDLKKKLAKARKNVNTAVPDEDPIKAAKKREAELAKQQRKEERAALAIIRAEKRAKKAAIKQREREEAAAAAGITLPGEDPIKAAKKREAELAKQQRKEDRAKRVALKQKQKEAAAALAAQMEAKRLAAAQAGLEYDEAPPGYEEAPESEVTVNPPKINESIVTEESQRIYGESIEVANKAEGVENAPKVITEGISPPPEPIINVEVRDTKNKTKSAVAQAFAKKKKRKKRKNGTKIPGFGRSNTANDIDVEDCNFEFNEFDPITQKVKRGLAKRFFFSYTEDILKEYMQGEDYLVCTGGLIDIQGIIALGIEFIIDSPQARYEYGSIGTNAQLILQLIDGEIITLLSEQSDSGRVNRSTDKTEFSTVFLINPREEKTLRKTEISAVRMVWGTGYEDYDVNEIDFLIDQFQCIDAARDN